MQGRQNAANSERKGPHKSMHCKFCKPPGVVTPEKATRPQMETKTKIHLVHEAADLRLCDIYDEPGVPEVDAEACVCVLEGENPCPKCVPDKKRAVTKKKTCRCPKGAKPNPNMTDGTAPKKVKPKDVDDEFWWEKYSREHDAITRETWAAYMAQRRKDKKLLKCQKLEQEELIAKKNRVCPSWYQKLSCQQMIYVEFLSTAIRLDSDENITDRTFFVLGGIGLYPRPSRKVLKKCLRFCRYNAVQFLDQLRLFAKEDDFFHEKAPIPSATFLTNMHTWNERLIMNAVCHLEFPTLLRELMDRLPELPRQKIMPPISYPVFPKPCKKTYENPYDEPIWRERINWVEKMKIDRLNRCRAHMDTKRVKIPPLALVRRPSLIDARPPFLAQIEANEQASRRIQKQDERRSFRKHPVSTFNSSVDVTAIAGIEASEISTTDKADTDEICVFLREPSKEPEFVDEDEAGPEKEVRFMEVEPEILATEVDGFNRPLSDLGDYSAAEDGDIPFRTPPKTQSGMTIDEPCGAPKSSPGPPAIHYDIAKRELDVINEDLCRFHPFVSATSTHAINPDEYNDENEVTLQLMSAAEKLKEFAHPGEKAKDGIRTRKKKFKKKNGSQTRKKDNEKTSPPKKTTKKKVATLKDDKDSKESFDKNKNEEDEGEKVESNEDILDRISGDFAEEDDLLLSFASTVKKEKKLSRKESIVSDPDPHSDDEWLTRRPCIRDATDTDSKPPERRKKKAKTRKRRKAKSAKSAGKKEVGQEVAVKERVGGTAEPLHARAGAQSAEATVKAAISPPEGAAKADKETMTECRTGEYDDLYDGKKGQATDSRRTFAGGEAFEGKLRPLLDTIIQDLAEEGFVSASYQGIATHPDIRQLIKHLKGEILTKSKRDELYLRTKSKWGKMKEFPKFAIPELGIASTRTKQATWRDKGWLSRRAKIKKDEFYFKVASSRADSGREIYKTLYQAYFGTGRYLKIYYAYMLPKYEEAILRGVL